eukprot:TRINITY_DN17325_c0_g1_i1.p1 TRINITY_DN17325_c0_g1~~TRINITY_DN17325_c0_g1_i1.p1  ORF type:complete len:443 (+),score=96.76 TRINITY_DN17325_c0_g1_i1:68-1330(+)
MDDGYIHATAQYATQCQWDGSYDCTGATCAVQPPFVSGGEQWGQLSMEKCDGVITDADEDATRSHTSGTDCSTPLTPPEPRWPSCTEATVVMGSTWADSPSVPQTVAPVSPWDAVLPATAQQPLPRGGLRIVHPTGASVVMTPKWETATARDARMVASAEWCVPPDTIRIHRSNLHPVARSCRGTGLADTQLLSQCVSPGGELYALPVCPTDHLRDPTHAKARFRKKPLPERLAQASSMLAALAESPRDCSLLQRELDAAAELGRDDWCEPVLRAVAESCDELLTHHCGNYLLRRCTECWPQIVAPAILKAARGRASELACDRHASYVLQACLTACRGTDAMDLLLELLAEAHHLCSDSYGNYVLQTAIDECPQALLSHLERTVGPAVAGCTHAVKLRRKLMLRTRTRRRASDRAAGTSE